jgi:hypothetical protein
MQNLEEKIVGLLLGLAAGDRIGGPVRMALRVAESLRELARSIDFAGPANYCPVLVGSIGGARWGRAQIDETSLHHHGDLMARLKAAAFALASGWQDVEAYQHDA